MDRRTFLQGAVAATAALSVAGFPETVLGQDPPAFRVIADGAIAVDGCFRRVHIEVNLENFFESQSEICYYHHLDLERSVTVFVSSANPPDPDERIKSAKGQPCEWWTFHGKDGRCVDAIIEHREGVFDVRGHTPVISILEYFGDDHGNVCLRETEYPIVGM